MYVKPLDQMNLYDFMPPFGDTLEANNRWVKLAQTIDWESLENQYEKHFAKNGKKAISFRVAFGALVIKRALNLSDNQLIALIRENPYMQYFLGYMHFTNAPPFSASALKLFRQRIPKVAVADAVRTFKAIVKKQKAT